MRSLVIRFAACTIGLGCGAASPPYPAPASFSDSDASAFYRDYESALKAHRRDTIAHFYHADGALFVLNGERIRNSRVAIDSMYRTQWQGPVFFSFDSLQFESLNPDQILVTGRFRWLSAQSPDTGRYAYLSILDRTPKGLKIRLEHETQLPAPRRP